MDISEKKLKDLKDMHMREVKLGDVPHLFIERKGKVELKHDKGKKIELV